MNVALEKFRQNILKIKDRATERSYYKDISNFIVEFADGEKYKDFSATPEESSTVIKREIGFPDITIRQNDRLVGWIEVKLPDDALSSEKFYNQFKKYKDSLENILFTNLREWQLWQWDEKGKPIKEAELLFDITNYAIGEEEKLKNILLKFFEGRPYEARTPKQLALALAKKTKLLSQQVEEALESSDENSDLSKLKTTFEKTLIQNINPHQFANMVAETMAYSLFLAFLEHSKRDNDQELNLRSAIDYLPTNVPILADLYSLINKVSQIIPTIHKATESLIDQLKAADIDKIHAKLVEHKPGEDPVIQFYEPFLKEYDPKEREARGVYYTPKPVVDYIVRSVDYILREKFGKTKGLADESAHLLDPATGTGTFLMSAIQEIHANIKKENKALGDEMVQREFNKVVMNHILKHFYGFELLVAPYAVAHLKLTLLLEDLGFNFEMTKNDSDPDNDRLKVYLANTLDDPNKPPQTLFGFNSIAEESEAARKVKKDVPILAIIGNPPYSNFGQMNRGEWILNLLKDYKVGLNERKINLDDDFIKFIRFAQWKLQQTGQGIFAMITNNTFIDGITHRQMRKSIMDTFDEIYIYNLHGNLRKKEVCPDGSKDENVFNIMTGVSINIFVKFPEKQEKTVVKYCDLWGLRENKFATLLEENFQNTKWQILQPKEPNWFFVKKDYAGDQEYENFVSVNKLFTNFNSGIQTGRDDLSVQFDIKKLESIIDDFKKFDDSELQTKYLLKDSSGWTIKKAKNDVIKNSGKYVDFTYRPFDIKKTYFTGFSGGFIKRPRTETMEQMFKNNIGLISCRNQTFNSVAFVSKNIVDLRTYSNPGSIGTDYLFPLYSYPKDGQLRVGEAGNIPAARMPNIDLTTAREIASLIGVVYYPVAEYPTKPGDERLTPEDIFYYAYAIFYSPTYRSRYAEQLKIDFPRLPLTSDKELFKKLVAKGNELVNLHLFGENPFDNSKTIFDEPEKWGVKIGGRSPENLDDWKVSEVRYEVNEKRVYVNPGQYFEGIEKNVWEFMIGGYQVCEKWLKDRKKAERCLSVDDLKHYMKIVVSLRETIRIMNEIDKLIPEWPMK